MALNKSANHDSLMMDAEFKRRLDDIDWTQFHTAYGRADKVPDQLMALSSAEPAVAMNASHDLWCGLCHQHAFVSSAALPALPFILAVLDSANDTLTIEILDILVGFAVCSKFGSNESLPEEWKKDLREKLRCELPRFQVMTKHDDEQLAAFAEMLVEELT